MATNTAPRTPSDTDESTQPATDRTDDTALPTLAEVLDRVASQGPQIITRGDDRFIVQGAQDFEAVTRKKRKYKDFKDLLLNGPRFDGIEIEREPWTMRDIDL